MPQPNQPFRPTEQSSHIPLNLFLMEFYVETSIQAAYVSAGCIEEAIQKFRDEGFDNQIIRIAKTSATNLIL